MATGLHPRPQANNSIEEFNDYFRHGEQDHLRLPDHGLHVDKLSDCPG